RYPFALLPSGALMIADAAPEGDFGDQAQVLLADGGPVRSAGGLRVERTNEALLRVTLDADSFAYCPTPDSLHTVLAALAQKGVSSNLLRVDYRPRPCPRGALALAGDPANPRPRFGGLMREIGLRFETTGRALLAGEVPMAKYQVEEIREIFAIDL